MKALFLLLLGAVLGVAALPYFLFQQAEMPAGTNLASPDYSFSTAELLVDRTVWDADKKRHELDHEIFDTMLREIRKAETFLIADFFLWNPWKGAIGTGGSLRSLSKELAEALIDKRIQNPNMPMLVITDPINRIYGDLNPDFYDRMAQAGIPIVFTDLTQMPDSNRIYAPQAQFWKKFLSESSDDEAKRWLPNPFDPFGAKLTTAQIERLLYFKANHRKVLITGRLNAPARLLMPSLNPADGSANHSNIGLLVDGNVARFAASSELEIANWSAQDSTNVHLGLRGRANEAIQSIAAQLNQIPQLRRARDDGATVAYRSEASIRNELLLQLKQSVHLTRIDIGMFYLSDREVIEAIKEAIERGAIVRILLDANRDAFGREKNGIPNRIVAHELMELANRHKVEVRWAATHGEQFHGKFLRIRSPQQQVLFLGSANWTRRNLANLNLESNLILSNASSIHKEFDAYFDSIWNNTNGAIESLDYEAFAEQGWSLKWKSWLYRFQEWSGASTF